MSRQRALVGFYKNEIPRKCRALYMQCILTKPFYEWTSCAQLCPWWAIILSNRAGSLQVKVHLNQGEPGFISFPVTVRIMLLKGFLKARVLTSSANGKAFSNRLEPDPPLTNKSTEGSDRLRWALSANPLQWKLWISDLASLLQS